MDFLGRAQTQLQEMVRSMTPGSRLMSGLLVALLTLGIVYLGTQQTARPEVDLLHGQQVSAGQLSIMEAAFGKANLNGYQVRGSSIFVPQGLESTYLAALKDEKALPLEFGEVIDKTVDDAHLLESTQEHADRIKIAKQKELANMICAMPGVDRAYVFYDADKTAGFNPEKIVTAMACVKPAGTSQLNESQIAAIRNLVSGAYAGLKPECVVVSDLNGRTWSGSTVNAIGDPTNYVSQKRAYEQDLKAKILNALSYIPNVTVELNVEFERERSDHVRLASHLVASRTPIENDLGRVGDVLDTKTRQAATAPPPSAMSALGALLGSTGGTAASGAAPNMIAPNGVINTAPGSAPALAPGMASPGGEPYEKDGLRLTPISARVSVGVPSGFFMSVWRQQNPGQPEKTPDQAALDRIRQEEIGNIQRCVAPLLPPTKLPATLAELVTVTVFQELPTAAPPAADPMQIALDWLARWWKPLAWIGVGLVVLLALRSIVRDKPAKIAEPAEQPAIDKIDETVEEPETEQPGKMSPPHWPQRKTVVAKDKDHATPSPHSPPSAADRPLREELSMLVENDPEAAAEILRNWIGHVS